MTAIPRPGTPFPHDERSMHSYMPALAGWSTSPRHALSAPRYSPRSLHYPLAEKPAPTPPSLLKRRASIASQSSDSSSAILRSSSTSTLGSASPTPFALHMSGSLSRRRESTRSNSSFSSSSSSSTSSEPRTPVLRARPGYEPEAEILEADDEYDPESEYEIGEPALPYRAALSKHSLSALSARYTHATTRSLAPRLPTIESPQRPKLVRRGTPRPAQTLSTLGITPAHGAGADKRYISLIDGGAWLVRH